MLARGFRTAAGDTTLRVRASALRNAGSLDVKKPTRLMKSGKTQRRPRLVRSQVAKNHLAAFTTKHSRRIGNDSNVKQQRIGFFSVATEIAFERPLTKKKKIYAVATSTGSSVPSEMVSAFVRRRSGRRTRTLQHNQNCAWLSQTASRTDMTVHTSHTHKRGRQTLSRAGGGHDPGGSSMRRVFPQTNDDDDADQRPPL